MHTMSQYKWEKSIEPLDYVAPRLIPRDESSPKRVLFTTRCNCAGLSRGTYPYIRVNWRNSILIARYRGGNGTDSFCEAHFIDRHLHLRTLENTATTTTTTMTVLLTHCNYFSSPVHTTIDWFPIASFRWRARMKLVVLIYIQVKTVFRESCITNYAFFSLLCLKEKRRGSLNLWSGLSAFICKVLRRKKL